MKKYFEQAKIEQAYFSKLKEFKVWANTKSPDLIKPVLSYALDWLSPELLGTGFAFTHVSDDEIRARIPYRSNNCDYQNQIHLGLVTNAATELVQAFLNHHFPHSLFTIEAVDLKIQKKLKWSKALNLKLAVNLTDLDDFFIQFQKNKAETFECEVLVQPEHSKKSDRVQLKFLVQKTFLLS